VKACQKPDEVKLLNQADEKRTLTIKD